MNAYKFANLPSNSSVDFGVTMLVSVWFLVAAGAILANPAAQAERTLTPVVTVSGAEETTATAVAIAPEARLTILVEARRSANL